MSDTEFLYYIITCLLCLGVVEYVKTSTSTVECVELTPSAASKKNKDKVPKDNADSDKPQTEKKGSKPSTDSTQPPAKNGPKMSKRKLKQLTKTRRQEDALVQKQEQEQSTTTGKQVNMAVLRSKELMICKFAGDFEVSLFTNMCTLCTLLNLSVI